MKRLVVVFLLIAGCHSKQAPTPQPPTAENPIRFGSVEIRIAKVKVGKIRAEGTKSEIGPFVAIELEIKNISDSKKIDFTTWQREDKGSRAAGYASLRDNVGNEYDQVDLMTMPRITDKGIVHTKTLSESIYPGKMIIDTLVFQPPVENVQYLDLELPAISFGEDGKFRVRIPVGMIEK